MQIGQERFGISWKTPHDCSVHMKSRVCWLQDRRTEQAAHEKQVGDWIQYPKPQ